MKGRNGVLSEIPVQQVRDKIFMFLLWLIKKKGMHGYELIKTLRAAGFSIATPARVYPLLAMMKRSGMISQHDYMHGKRRKTVYAITKKGREFIKRGKKAYFSGLVAEFIREMIG